MRKINLILWTAMVLVAFLPSASAHCPLCTTGAAVGVGVARFYGVDDSIVGLFIGAVLISSALWFNKWLKKRINFPLQELLMVVVSFLMFAVPFYYGGLITSFSMVKTMPNNYSLLGLGALGIDRLLFGMILGTLAIWGAFKLSDTIKGIKGKVLWPYQGLSFMVMTLLVLTAFLRLVIQ